jgi:hypothetical protein
LVYTLNVISLRNVGKHSDGSPDEKQSANQILLSVSDERIDAKKPALGGLR